MGNTGKAATGLEGATKATGLSLTDMWSGLQLAGQALAMVEGALDATVGSALAWGNTVDKLSRASGESAEATSKMAIVFGDFGIQADSLDKVIKQFTTNGLQFNMATIKDLAKQYQAIQDPVARDEFAFKNFGRSALDMTEILSKTPEELQAVGDAADRSGKILSGAGVKALQDYGVQAAQLTDKFDGLKIAVGTALVPALTVGTDALSTHLTALELANKALATGKINILEYFHASGSATDQIAYFTKKLDASSVAIVQATEDTDRHNSAQVKLSGAYTATLDPMVHINQLMADYHDKAAAAAQSDLDIAAASDALILANQTTAALYDGIARSTGAAATAYEDLATGLKDASAMQIAEAALSELKQLADDGKLSAEQYKLAYEKVGLEYGIVTPQSLAAASAVDTLNSLLATGKINPEEYAAAIGKITPAAADGKVSLDELGVHLDTTGGQAHHAAQDIDGVAIAVDNLHDKTITITTNFQSLYGNSYGPPASSGGTSGPPAGNGGGYINPAANGPTANSSTTIVQNIYNPPPAASTTMLQTAKAVTSGW